MLLSSLIDDYCCYIISKNFSFVVALSRSKGSAKIRIIFIPPNILRKIFSLRVVRDFNGEPFLVWKGAANVQPFFFPATQIEKIFSGGLFNVSNSAALLVCKAGAKIPLISKPPSPWVIFFRETSSHRPIYTYYIWGGNFYGKWAPEVTRPFTMPR